MSDPAERTNDARQEPGEQPPTEEAPEDGDDRPLQVARGALWAMLGAAASGEAPPDEP